MLIPNTINGKPFTLNYLEELIKKPKSKYITKYKYYGDLVKKTLGNKSYPSHWILMTKDTVLGSRSMTYSWCCNMINNYSKRIGIPYELPHELDAATSILMHYVKTGERLYNDNPWTYTYSQDVDKHKDPLVVGGFDYNGLCISSIFNSSSHGVAGVRKF